MNAVECLLYIIWSEWNEIMVLFISISDSPFLLKATPTFHISTIFLPNPLPYRWGTCLYYCFKQLLLPCLLLILRIGIIFVLEIVYWLSTKGREYFSLFTLCAPNYIHVLIFLIELLSFSKIHTRSVFSLMYSNKGCATE